MIAIPCTVPETNKLQSNWQTSVSVLRCLESCAATSFFTLWSRPSIFGETNKQTKKSARCHNFLIKCILCGKKTIPVSEDPPTLYTNLWTRIRVYLLAGIEGPMALVLISLHLDRNHLKRHRFRYVLPTNLFLLGKKEGARSPSSQTTHRMKSHPVFHSGLSAKAN